MQLDENGFPRRNRVDLLTPAESVIRQAMLAVEDMPAHPLLTDAVTLIEQAKNKVADFVELSGQQQTVAESASDLDENGRIKMCGKEFEEYGVKRTCGCPPGHEGRCMTWSEYVARQQTDIQDIPAGD